MDERSSARVEVDKPIVVEIGGQPLRVLMYNLSTSGCMIDGADKDCLGKFASVQLGKGLTVDGLVVWQRGVHKGIRFAATIESTTIESLGFKPLLHSDWESSAVAAAVGKELNGIDLRQHRRVSVDRHVMCQCNDHQSPVFLYDLSVGGCMFESEAEIPRQGERVAVALAGADYSAEVVWAVGQNIGAAFTVELHPAIVEHYGFDPAAVQFEVLKPRDRFGRHLPPLPSLRCVSERGQT